MPAATPRSCGWVDTYMPWLEAMLTTLHGMPISAVSAGTSGTVKEAVSNRMVPAAATRNSTPAISTRRTPKRSIARTANGVAITDIAASGSIRRPTTPGS